MRFYIGKWYLAVRFRNDLCIGVGRAPKWMHDEADLSRLHGGLGIRA